MAKKEDSKVEEILNDTEEATEEVTEETIEENVEEISQDSEEASNDKKLEEYMDRYKRTLAEFDNFRKRTEKEKLQTYHRATKDVLEKILPIVDNFERAIGALPEEEKSNSFAQGIEMIYKQFLNMLNESGVQIIEAVGQEFNPDFHNAVMHTEDDSAGENVVVEELQKGYMYKDSVLRHSMVKVAN
ncbi:molecular chaperone GrpE [Natranaerovirga pectinivora]|uniref:Protein GrpE n=1 Tax=Natranaerovirga pectinivora TaxID=682400 RepID=A0A4R3MQS3_9FIRM|nr:nucleotide exchange factor GrpE [Natranaerovirga pectinivora]TCT16873.1 molecular chaperone GrpE [Natranaerovirga pectinivora]